MIPSDIGMILAEDYNICVRTGFHCAPLIHAFLDTEKLKGTVRISIGGSTTYEDIDTLFFALKSL